MNKFIITYDTFALNDFAHYSLRVQRKYLNTFAYLAGFSGGTIK